ncbi:MAG: hypothetical protein CMJ64_11040 [Planctomycetaceae bacterium]|nr:hypothetical protein [Planctomycetaceae bacterium]
MTTSCPRLLLCCLALTLAACDRGSNSAPNSNPAPASPFANARVKSVVRPKSESRNAVNERTASLQFFDIASERELEHVYDNGMRGTNLMVEATGGGAGWLDFDGDGHWGLYLNQGGDPAGEADQPLDQLFRNVDGKRFEAVTGAARIYEPRYAQGVAVGDFDSDGFDDIYVTNVGRNTLFHNNGDGHSMTSR